MSNSGNTRKNVWIATAAAAAMAVLSPQAYAQAQQISAQTISIQSQSLGDALRALARQTGTQVVFDPGTVAGKHAPSVSGAFTADEALHRLLTNSGLTYQSTGPGTYTILAQATEARPTQDADSQSASDTAPEEIIVTAQKRDERLIETPLSVSVLSGDSLLAQGSTQFRDFANSVPGLTLTTQGAGNTQISLRGVTAGVDASPTVGVYVDDVPYGSSTPFALAGRFSLDAGIFDMDHIEVLRGPQGTLYGSSTMGGLIKYVTRRPNTDAFGVDTYAGVSDTEHGGINYNAAVVANVPLSTDRAALRMTGFESHDGGYIDNLTRNDKDVNQSDVYGGRFDLLLTPNSALTIRLTAFLQDISRDGEGTADYSLTTGRPIDGDLDQRRGFAEPFDQRFRLYSGTVGYDFGSANLTSITSYQTSHTIWPVDVTTLYVPILQGFLGRTYSAVQDYVLLTNDKFTQEVRLSSEGGGPIEWIIGGFYTAEESGDNEQFLLADPAGNPSPNDLFFYNGASHYTEAAAFGDLTWHLTPKFDVTGGIRYAQTKSEFTQTGAGLFGLSAPRVNSSDDVVTYLANARYHFTDHTTAYVRYATGYRPGGPVIITSANPTDSPTFDPDHLASYEVGLKTETSDRHFGADLSAYYIDWSNIQLFTTNAGGFGTFVNAPGGATIRGAELTLTGRSGGLSTSAAFAFQDAELSEADAILGGSKGERLPNVPRFTASLNADYTLPVSSPLAPTIGASLRYISDRDSSFDGNSRFPQHHLPAYTTFDVHAGLTLGAVDTQFFVRNVFDERGQLSAFTQFGTARVGIEQPRTIGVSASAHF